ncbi:MFS transporter [Streptomyces sp. NPDC001601]|uniref:MFS transporter n=1 Tax=Streptomyces sp. NPDC001601 TaxID=3364592 RepID=UPI0036D13D84
MVSSLGAPLVPAIARSTHVSLASARWTLTITVLVAVAVTPVMGRLGDTRHRRSVVLTGLALVTTGSVIAALGTSNFAVLLLGRALQGAGQGLAPMTITAASDSFADERRARVIAALSIANAAGIGLGYPLTGLLAQGLGVSGAYWFGAAITAAALATATAVVPAPRDRPATRVDLLGAVLFAVPVTALLLATSEGEHWGWNSPAVMVLIGVALLVGAGWARYEIRTPQPLVDLGQLRIRPVLSAHIILTASSGRTSL